MENSQVLASSITCHTDHMAKDHQQKGSVSRDCDQQVEAIPTDTQTTLPYTLRHSQAFIATPIVTNVRRSLGSPLSLSVTEEDGSK